MITIPKALAISINTRISFSINTSIANHIFEFSNLNLTSFDVVVRRAVLPHGLGRADGLDEK